MCLCVRFNITPSLSIYNLASLWEHCCRNKAVVITIRFKSLFSIQPKTVCSIDPAPCFPVIYSGIFLYFCTVQQLIIEFLYIVVKMERSNGKAVREFHQGKIHLKYSPSNCFLAAPFPVFTLTPSRGLTCLTKQSLKG